MAALLTRLEGRFPVAFHEHVAVFHRGGEYACRFISYLDEGLASGDLCHCMAREDVQGEIIRRLRGLRPDLELWMNSGRLSFCAGSDDRAALARELKQTFARAERTHAPALRWLDIAGWAEAAGLPREHFFEYHALMNYQVKHHPSAIICQFALESLDADSLCAAIAVHRHLIVENTFVRDNPFYSPPEKFWSASEENRHREVQEAFREAGFDTEKFLAALAGYGKLHST
ncbi:MAG: MEDS domain-containing protein [Deltaproteobacteria bacterium]